MNYLVRANLEIVKGHCSKCPEDTPMKFGLRLTIEGNQVILCIDCLKEAMKAIERFKKGEENAKRMVA